MSLKIVSLNILVDEAAADKLQDYLSKSTTPGPSFSGIAEDCKRLRIKIEGFSTTRKDAGGNEVLDPTFDQGNPSV